MTVTLPTDAVGEVRLTLQIPRADGKAENAQGYAYLRPHLPLGTRYRASNVEVQVAARTRVDFDSQGRIRDPLVADAWPKVLASDAPGATIEGLQWVLEFHLSNVEQQPGDVIFTVPAKGYTNVGLIVDTTPVPAVQQVVVSPAPVLAAAQAVEQRAAEIAAIAASTDGVLAAALRDPASASRAAITPVIAAQVGTRPEVVQAAAQVAAAGQNLGVILLERQTGATPDPTIGMTTVRNGPPSFGAPAKQGTGSLAGPALMTVPFDLPDGGVRCIEMFVRVDPNVAIPRTTNIFAIGSLNNQVAGFYMNLQTTGVARFNSSNRDSANIKDGSWHHVEMTLSRTGNVRSTPYLFLDGAAVAGSGPNNATDAQDILQLGGLHFLNSFDWYSGIRIDQLRISNIARHTAAFTPPATIDSDANTVALYSMDPQSDGQLSYPARPSVAAGMLTYKGRNEPTDWLAGDVWFNTSGSQA